MPLVCHRLCCFSTRACRAGHSWVCSRQIGRAGLCATPWINSQRHARGSCLWHRTMQSRSSTPHSLFSTTWRCSHSQPHEPSRVHWRVRTGKSGALPAAAATPRARITAAVRKAGPNALRCRARLTSNPGATQARSPPLAGLLEDASTEPEPSLSGCNKVQMPCQRMKEKP